MHINFIQFKGYVFKESKGELSTKFAFVDTASLQPRVASLHLSLLCNHVRNNVNYTAHLSHQNLQIFSYSILEHRKQVGAQVNKLLRKIVPNRCGSWNETVFVSVYASEWSDDVLCVHVVSGV